MRKMSSALRNLMESQRLKRRGSVIGKCPNYYWLKVPKLRHLLRSHRRSLKQVREGKHLEMLIHC